MVDIDDFVRSRMVLEIWGCKSSNVRFGGFKVIKHPINTKTLKLIT